MVIYLSLEGDMGMENKKKKTINNKHHCDCCHEHHEHENEEVENIDDLICDLDPSKICDNCMKCLTTFNTDEKGYVSIGIDGVDASQNITLNDLYKMYGLDDED